MPAVGVAIIVRGGGGRGDGGGGVGGIGSMVTVGGIIDIVACFGLSMSVGIGRNVRDSLILF